MSSSGDNNSSLKTLEEKLNAISRLEAGESASSVACSIGVSKRSVERWRQQKSYLEKLHPSTLKQRTKTRRDTTALREIVYEWFNTTREKGYPITSHLIAGKAEEVNRQLNGPADFVCTEAWIKCFKQAYGIRSIKTTSEVKSTDCDAADEFRNILRSIMSERGITEEQLYNADETGLYYQCLPDKTLGVCEEKNAPGLKQSKQRLTVLVCSNVTGNHKPPLLVIGKSANPRAFTNVNKAMLPTVYASSSKAWMTGRIFEGWVEGQLEPEVQAYLKSKNLPLRACLIVDNAPSHKVKSVQIGIIYIVYLPPNVTALVQPMDQGAIALLKRAYRKGLMLHLLNAEDLENAIKNVNIFTALRLITVAWSNIKSSTLAKCWRALGLNDKIGKDMPYSENEQNELDAEIINAASVMGHNLTSEDIAEWCASDPTDVDGEVSDEGYQLLNPIRIHKSDPGCEIRHEEGVEMIDRSLMYIKQSASVADPEEGLWGPWPPLGIENG